MAVVGLGAENPRVGGSIPFMGIPGHHHFKVLYFHSDPIY